MNVGDNTTEGCPDPWSDPNLAPVLSDYVFWFGGVLSTVLALLGIVGNVATIAVFSKKEMRRYIYPFYAKIAY